MQAINVQTIYNVSHCRKILVTAVLLFFIFLSQWMANAQYTPNYNTSLGEGALLTYSQSIMNKGNFNTAIGAYSRYSITSAMKNTWVGPDAGKTITGGSNSSVFGNVMPGNQAGANSTATNSSEMSYDVLIGYAAERGFNFRSRKTFILNNQASVSNPLLFGYFAENRDHNEPSSKPSLNTQLGINTSNLDPTAAH